MAPGSNHDQLIGTVLVGIGLGWLVLAFLVSTVHDIVDGKRYRAEQRRHYRENFVRYTGPDGKTYVRPRRKP